MVIRPRRRVDQSVIAGRYGGQVGHGQPGVAVERFVDPLPLPRPLEVSPGSPRPQIRLLDLHRH
jgi:hypothetical protein